MITLPVVYSQRDPRWAAQRLGTVDGTTLGSEGCYVSSFADCACYFGHTITPQELDNLFTDNHWYYNQNNNHNDPANLLADGDLSKAFPDITFVGTDNYQSIPADLNKLKTYLQDPTFFVMVEIDMGAGNTHFTPVTNCDGVVVTIANPWDGQVETFANSYGDPATKILKFVVYKGQVASAGTYVDKPTFDKLVHNSEVSDDLNDYVSLPHDSDWTAIKPKLDQITIDKQNAQNANQNAQSALAEALTKYNADEQTIADLTAKYLLDEQKIKDLQATPVPPVTTQPVVPPVTLSDRKLKAIHDVTYDKWSVFPIPTANYWVTKLHQIKKIFEVGI